MYTDREAYYTHLIRLYSRYIPTYVRGRYNGALVYIDTDTRIFYDDIGQAIGKFRH